MDEQRDESSRIEEAGALSDGDLDLVAGGTELAPIGDVECALVHNGMTYTHNGYVVSA